MKKSKLLAILLAATLTASSLAGCSPKADNTSSGGRTAQVPAAPERSCPSC